MKEKIWSNIFRKCLICWVKNTFFLINVPLWIFLSLLIWIKDIYSLANLYCFRDENICFIKCRIHVSYDIIWSRRHKRRNANEVSERKTFSFDYKFHLAFALRLKYHSWTGNTLKTPKVKVLLEISICLFFLY